MLKALERCTDRQQDVWSISGPALHFNISVFSFHMSLWWCALHSNIRIHLSSSQVFSGCMALRSRYRQERASHYHYHVMTTGRRGTLGFEPRTYRVSVTPVKGNRERKGNWDWLFSLTLHSTHIHHQHGSQLVCHVDHEPTKCVSL